MVRPTRRLASALRFPDVTKREENDAATMRRPTKWGARVRTTVSTSGSSGMIVLGQVDRGQIDQDIAVLDLHRVGSQLQEFIHLAQASSSIELPAMKRASEYVAVERAVSQRAARMRADAVQGVQRAVYIAHRHRILADFKLHRRARGQVSQGTHLYESHPSL